jgi:hypothetical protein
LIERMDNILYICSMLESSTSGRMFAGSGGRERRAGTRS